MTDLSTSPDDIIFRLVEDWFQVSNKWLLIVDNADCHGDFYDSASSKCSEPSALARRLPGSVPHLKRILFTSRDIDLGRKLSHAESVIVDRLSDTHSSSLLRRKIAGIGRRQKLADVDDEFSEEDVQALLVTLDYLPLAITHAASYIKKMNMPVREYTSKLQESDETLISYLEQPATPLRPNSSTPRSVVQTWLHSFNLILSKNPKAAHMLCLMACMERNAIHEKHLPPWTDEQASNHKDEDFPFISKHHIQFPEREVDRKTALYELEGLSLIRRQKNGGMFSIHRFVQIVTIHWLKTEDKSRRVGENLHDRLYFFQHTVTQYILNRIAFESQLFVNEADFQITLELLPHAEWLLSHLDALSVDAIKIREHLLQKLSKFYLASGDFYASKEACQKLFHLSNTNDRKLKAIGTLIGALNNLGEFDALNEVTRELTQELREREGMETKSFTWIDSLPMMNLMDAGKLAAVVQLARGLLENLQIYDQDAVEPCALATANACLALCLLLEGAEPENTEVQRCIDMVYTCFEEAKNDVFFHNLARVFAQALAAAKRFDEAEIAIRQATERTRSLCGSSHAETLLCEVVRIRILFQRLAHTQANDNLLTLKRLQDIRSISQKLCPLDNLCSNPKLHQSLWMQHAISTHVTILMGLYAELLFDISRITEHFGSDDADQAALNECRRLLLERHKDMSDVYRDTIRYCTMSIRCSSCIWGEASVVTISSSWALCAMYASENAYAQVRQHLCDRSKKIVAALQGGMHIEKAKWPSLFNLYSQTAQKANLDYYTLIVLASIRAERVALPLNLDTAEPEKLDPETGEMYLGQLQKVDDRAMLLEVYANYTREQYRGHYANCDSCGKVSALLLLMIDLLANQWQRIWGIRHACSACGDGGFDLCSDCIDKVRTLHPEHALAPVFIDEKTYRPVFSEHRLMRGRDPVSAVEPSPNKYHREADAGASVNLTVSKHWRMRIAIERCYESEPDEGGRVRTRFAQHCDRGRPSQFAAQGANRKRQRRSKSHVVLRNREFPSEIHDSVPMTFDTSDLWEDILTDCSSSSLLRKIGMIEERLEGMEVQQHMTSDDSNVSSAHGWNLIRTSLTGWVRIMV